MYKWFHGIFLKKNIDFTSLNYSFFRILAYCRNDPTPALAYIKDRGVPKKKGSVRHFKLMILSEYSDNEIFTLFENFSLCTYLMKLSERIYFYLPSTLCKMCIHT